MGVYGGFAILLVNKTNKEKTVLEIILEFKKEIIEEMRIDIGMAYADMKGIEYFPPAPPTEEEVPEDMREPVKEFGFNQFIEWNKKYLSVAVKPGETVLVGFCRNSAGFLERTDVIRFTKIIDKDKLSLSLIDDIGELFECS